VAFPAWLARIVTVPVPVRVTVEPVRLAGPETTEKVTVRPLLAVAETENGLSPKVFAGIGLKVMVDGIRTAPAPVAVKVSPVELNVKYPK